MAVYEVTLSDGTTIDVEANSPEEAAQIAARRIEEKYTAAQPTSLHGADLAAQREADALKERAAAYAPADDPLAKPGALARKPDLFDVAMAGQIPQEKPKSLQQDIADRLQVFGDTLLSPLASRNVPAGDPVNTLTRMVAEPIAQLPAALVRDPAQAVQDYDPFHQIGRGYNNLVDAGGDVIEGDYGAAGPKALAGATEAMGGAMGLMGFKGGPKPPGAATTLAEAERMAANTRVGMPPEAAPVAPVVADGASDIATLKKQGFNTDKVYYHGSDKEFDTFNMNKVGTREIPWFAGGGASLSPDRAVARGYGDKVMPFYVRGKLLRVDNENPWPEWLPKGEAARKELEARGYAGLEIDVKKPTVEFGPDFRPKVDAQGKVVTTETSTPEIVVFDPANLVRADRKPTPQPSAVPQVPQPNPAEMTYEDVAELVRTAARGGMGSQQAVEALARAAPLNKDAAAAATRLGIDVPPDVMMDHRQLKEAIGLTRSMPGTLASASWADAVERAATKADEAMAMIDGSPDLSEVSDTVLKSMQDTQRALQAQSDDMYKLINAKISGAAPKAEAMLAAEAVAPAATPSQSWFHSGTITPDDVVDVTRGELGFHVGSKQSAEVRAKDWPSQKQTIGEYEVQGNFTRVPDMGQWGPDDYLTARRRSSVFDENLEPMWKELDALAKRDPGRKEWTAAVQDAAKRNGISGWEYKNAQEGGGMSRIIMDPQAVGAKPAAPSSPSTVTPIKQGAAEGAKPATPPPIVDLVNSRRLMDGVVRELGGDTSKLSPLEKELVNMASPGRKTPVTYAALMRMKSDVGQALEKASGPYKDVNSGILKRLYGALAEDQLANVERIGGKQLRDDLRLANQLTAKRKALEDRVVSLFGDERNGSIARKLVAAVQGGAKGDITGFNRVVHQLPADLRKKAVATAIAAASRETKTNGFGFAKYVDLYQGLRRNSEVYKTVVQTLGPDSAQFLNDLYKISKRITEARANVKTTGQANQALVQGLMAEGLVQKVMQSTPGRQATMGTATVLGGTFAGPAAGAASAMMVNALSKSSKNTLNAAGDLFASPEWQQLVAKVAAEDRVDKKAFNAARLSKAFQTWAKTAGITDPDEWLRTALASSIGTGFANKAAGMQPTEQQAAQ